MIGIYHVLFFLTLYLIRRYIKGRNCNVKADLTNQVIIITGANGGIGLETAKILAKQGGTIIMGCRD